jgi:hypothetical protein
MCTTLSRVMTGISIAFLALGMLVFASGQSSADPGGGGTLECKEFDPACENFGEPECEPTAGPNYCTTSSTTCKCRWRGVVVGCKCDS